MADFIVYQYQTDNSYEHYQFDSAGASVENLAWDAAMDYWNYHYNKAEAWPGYFELMDSMGNSLGTFEIALRVVPDFKVKPVVTST